MFFSPLVYAQISLSNRIQHCDGIRCEIVTMCDRL